MTPTFFTDRDLGRLFPQMLTDEGINVARHCDYFKDNTIDPEWLEEAGQYKWFCLSRDKKIRYNPKEKEAVMRGSVGLFLLIGKNVTHKDLAINFINTYPKVLKFIERYETPFIAKIYQSNKSNPHNRVVPGTVKLWLGSNGFN